MIPGSARTGGQFTRLTGQLPTEINKNNENTNKIHQPLAIALRFFYTGNCALLVCAFAAAQSSRLPRARVSSGGNVGVGLNALDSVNHRGWINNTAVGDRALTARYYRRL